MKEMGKKNNRNKQTEQKIVVTKDGPYVVTGDIPLGKEIIIADADHTPIRWEHGKTLPTEGAYYLCRCGHSKNKPFCDGAHDKFGFDGTETASREPHLDQAETTAGPGLILSDNVSLCAVARFCHRAGDAWNLTEQSQDPSSKNTAIEEACDCPSGRLIARDPKTGEAIEPKLEPSIGIIEDPAHKVSGPLWVKGGIPLEGADGKPYEIRNRMTICRCGRSKNKPFCDGTHISAGFKDGDSIVE
jgi:CDGSH-type Zn-finger protein